MEQSKDRKAYLRTVPKPEETEEKPGSPQNPQILWGKEAVEHVTQRTPRKRVFL